MGKPVAVEGDVKATPSEKLIAPADSGFWWAIQVDDTPCPKLSEGGKKAIRKSTCTFTFSGVDSKTGALVPGVEVVELAAAKTRLTMGGDVLLDGDNEKGPYGNKLQAVASQKKLTTA